MRKLPNKIATLLCAILLSVMSAYSLFAMNIAHAADVPDKIFGNYVIKVPSCFYHQGKNICEKFHWDTIAIAQRSSQTAYVSIETETINSHGCAFRGIGKWDGENLSAIGKSKNNVLKPGYLSEDTPWEACIISIMINGDIATYKVEEGTMQYCHSAFCSARGWLGAPEGVSPAQYKRKK